jgi:Zn-dependent protease with chaperone function
MTFAIRGLAVGLAWFVAIDALMALIVGAAARVWLRRTRPRSAALLLILRFTPVATAALFVVLFFVPAYWQFEPRHGSERVGITLVAIAGVAAAMLARMAWQTAATAIATARVTRDWTARSDPDGGSTAIVPMYTTPNGLTGVALIGILRPKLFVDRRIREALTASEMDAVVAHEMAHHARRDNVVRLCHAGCRDLLGMTRAGRTLERAWAALAEQTADSRASDGDRRSAVNLASALVKVARMMPREPRTSAVWSSLHELQETDLLPTRVRQLLSGEPLAPASSAGALGACGMLLGLAVVVGSRIHPLVHEATEVLVSLLP